MKFAIFVVLLAGACVALPQSASNVANTAANTAAGATRGTCRLTASAMQELRKLNMLLTSAISDFSGTATEVPISACERVSKFFEGVINTLPPQDALGDFDLSQGVLERLRSMTGGLGLGSGGLSGFGETLRGLASGAVKTGTNAFGSTTGALESAANTATGAISSATGGFDGLTGRFRDATGGVRSGARDALNAANQATAPIRNVLNTATDQVTAPIRGAVNGVTNAAGSVNGGENARAEAESEAGMMPASFRVGI